MLLLNKETVSLLDSDWNSVLLWPELRFNLVELKHCRNLVITNLGALMGGTMKLEM